MNLYRLLAAWNDGKAIRRGRIGARVFNRALWRVGTSILKGLSR